MNYKNEKIGEYNDGNNIHQPFLEALRRNRSLSHNGRVSWFSEVSFRSARTVHNVSEALPDWVVAESHKLAAATASLTSGDTGASFLAA